MLRATGCEIAERSCAAWRGVPARAAAIRIRRIRWRAGRARDVHRRDGGRHDPSGARCVAPPPGRRSVRRDAARLPRAGKKREPYRIDRGGIGGVERAGSVRAVARDEIVTLQKDNVNSRLMAQTHFLEQTGAVPALRREIEAFAAAEVRAAPRPLVERIEQPDRIDAGLVCAAGAHRADQSAELGQHRVELVLKQRRRGRGAAERAVAAIEHDDLVCPSSASPCAIGAPVIPAPITATSQSKSPAIDALAAPRPLRTSHHGSLERRRSPASSPRRARESAGAGGRVGYAATPAADRLPESSYTSRNGAVVALTAAVGRAIFVPCRCHRLSPPDDQCLAAPRHWRHVNAARIPRRRETSARGAANRHDRREVRYLRGLAQRLHYSLRASRPIRKE